MKNAGLLFFVSAFLFPILAVSQINGLNVRIVEYSTGSFVQTRKGLWTEYASENRQFNFKETNRDEWSVYLLDDVRNISIQLDLHNREINIFWDRPDRARIYTITQASSFPSQLILDEDTQAGDVLSDVSLINGLDVRIVEYSTGSFVQTREGLWTEYASENRQFNFKETNRDEWSVYLLDDVRNISIQLDLHNREINIFWDRPDRARIYTITQASSFPSQFLPIKPNNDPNGDDLTGSVALNITELDITLFFTGDTHIGGSQRGMNQQVAIDHVKMMNAATSDSGPGRIIWPAGTSSAGTKINDPAAVFIAGDLNTDKVHQLHSDDAELFDELYLRKPDERTGRSLRFKAYPGAGNHDWSSHGEWYSQNAHDANWETFRDIEKTLGENQSLFRPGNIPGLGSSYPPHYAVNFGKLLVVNLNTSIGEPCRQLSLSGLDASYFYTFGHYIEPDAENCNAKRWLMDLLEAHKNNYGPKAPIIIVQHYGYDDFSQNESLGYRGYWWHPDYRKMFAEIIKPYNVIAMFTGHEYSTGRIDANSEGPSNLVFGKDIFQSLSSDAIDPGWADGRAWADFNGDGKADYCRAVNRDEVRVILSAGDSFGKEITSGSLDPGWNAGRAWADFNGDGKADYCRAVHGDKVRVTLSTGNGFGKEITSGSLDPGWDAGRAWADFNGDGKADYCRAVHGDKVRVTLSTGNGFGKEITSGSIDQGWNASRTWIDINGDGMADYCRAVGKDQVRVTLSTGTGFGTTYTSPSIDPGWDAGRAWADVNGDGKLDYCRVVEGNALMGKLRTLLFTDNGFGEDVESNQMYPGVDAGRAWADRDGDGKADFLSVLGDRYEVITYGNLPRKSWLRSRHFGYIDNTDGTRSFDLNQRDFVSKMRDAGDKDGRAWVDFNNDGKLDYCRIVDNGYSVDENGNLRKTLQVTLSEEITLKSPVLDFNVPSGYGTGGFMAVRITDTHLDVATVLKNSGGGYFVKSVYSQAHSNPSETTRK